jgi:serine/threonine protein kinase
MDMAAGAAGIALTFCAEVCQGFQLVKVLPELAQNLSSRVQLFKPRLNQIAEGAGIPHVANAHIHIQTLQKVLNDIKEYLKELEDESIMSKAKTVLFPKSLLSEYERLNRDLDQCHSELHFDFEFDAMAERSAFENETKGLVCSLIEQTHEVSLEQRLHREMIQGNRQMLNEILKYIHSQKKLNLTTQNSPTIETATVLANSVDGVDIEELVTEQMCQEYEIQFDSIIHLDSAIGKGSFCLVYKAIYKNEDVAIKKPHFSDAGILEELLNHSRCDGSVFVASVLGFTRVNGTRSIVMQFAPCGSLATLLQTSSRKGDGRVLVKMVNSSIVSAVIPVWAILEILHQVALGIEFVHQRHVKHCDIKPDNILLDHDLTPKLTDFGSARELTESATHVSGSAAGSLYYMAPEVVKIASSGKGRYSYSVDIYGFGATIVTVCHQLYGSQQQSHHCSPPKDIDLPAMFPPELTTIKNNCLSEDPRTRYGWSSSLGTLVSRALESVSPDADIAPHPSYDNVHGVYLPDVAHVVRVAAQGQGKGHATSSKDAVVPPPVPPPRQKCDMGPNKKRNIAVGVVIVLVVAIIVVIVAAFTGPSPTPQPTIAPKVPPTPTQPPTSLPTVPPTLELLPVEPQTVALSQPPTLLPTLAPMAAPTSATLPDLIQLLSLVSPDGGTTLATPLTPQNKAVNWLANNTNLDSYSDERKIQ